MILVLCTVVTITLDNSDCIMSSLNDGKHFMSWYKDPQFNLYVKSLADIYMNWNSLCLLFLGDICVCLYGAVLTIILGML